MSIILEQSANEHELLAIHRDADAGLVAAIAIHNRSLGPAIGGCRVYPYQTIDSALEDVLRLSRGMTYKCAIAGIPYGGGKAVIVADPSTGKTLKLLHAMGAFVDSLGGRYITSFDSGTTMDDIRIIGERTKYVAGVGPGIENASRSTALGVFGCIETAWSMKGSGMLSDARVAVQGAGNVGARLASLLADAGASVLISDVDKERAALTAQACGGIVVDPAEILSADVDVLAPCAMGAILDEQSIDGLRARIVAGGANNQLATAEDGDRIRGKGITYCPDFLVNAGGIIDLHHQRLASLPGALADHLAELSSTLRRVLELADEQGVGTAKVAEAIAEARFRGRKG